MSIVSTLGEKPWLDKSTGHEVDDESLTGIRPKQIALNIFLATVSVLFSLFIVTFLARSQYPDFRALSGDVWQPFYDATRLWVNTGILFVGGAAIETGIVLFNKEKKQLALIALIVGLFFTVQFLIAQLMLWQHLYDLGYYVSSNPANSYFYVFTAIHAIHLVGGVLVLTGALIRFWRDSKHQNLQNSIYLCARYWRYLFVVWLVLFALMTGSPATYKTLAALCGY